MADTEKLIEETIALLRTRNAIAKLILREFAGKVQVDAIKAYQEFEAAMKDSRDYLKHIHGQGPIAHATDSYNAAKKRAADA